jgi:hypothetical protein
MRGKPYSPPPYSERARGHWLSSLLWMVAGAAATTTVALGLTQWQWGDRLLPALNSLLNPPKPEPKVAVQSIVLQQVREASELTTASFMMQAVVPTEQDATISGFVIGKTKLLYIAYGEVQAGVDLSQIRDRNVQISGQAIRIQLPAAQILDQKIDVTKSQVYDYNRGFLGLGPDAAPVLQTLAQQEALTQIRQAACDGELLQRASDRAKLVVSQLLNTAGYNSVTVDIPPASIEQCKTAAVNSPAPPVKDPGTANPANNRPLESQPETSQPEHNSLGGSPPMPQAESIQEAPP